MASTEDPVELTVDEAAEHLNVSTSHLLRQVSAGVLPSRGAGSTRTLALDDVLAYRELTDAQADRALEAMSHEAEDAGLYE